MRVTSDKVEDIELAFYVPLYIMHFIVFYALDLILGKDFADFVF